MSEKQKPVFISVTKYRFPRMAIVSIFHRISGFVLFLAIPVLLYLLHLSLSSSSSFATFIGLITTPWMKVVLWVIVSATLYHILAGLRHIIMDFGFAESLTAGKASATIVLILLVVAMILAGVWVW